MPNKLETELDNSANLLNEFANGSIKNTTDIIAQSFEVVGRKISQSLSLAAKNGEISFKSMAQSILRELSAIAIQKYVNGPINGLISVITKELPFFGARAMGGIVNRGGAYLVGENGPEMFVPKTAGSINPISNSAPVHININMAAGSNLNDIKKSSGQISLALARAVEKGRSLL